MEESEYHCCETETGKSIIETMPPETAVSRLGFFFKVFGDATRLRIIHCLSTKELCVHDLSSLINVSQSAVSHQLSLLKRENLIKSRRDGKYIYYSLNDDHVKEIYEIGMEHISHLL